MQERLRIKYKKLSSKRHSVFSSQLFRLFLLHNCFYLVCTTLFFVFVLSGCVGTTNPSIVSQTSRDYVKGLIIARYDNEKTAVRFVCVTLQDGFSLDVRSRLGTHHHNITKAGDIVTVKLPNGTQRSGIEADLLSEIEWLADIPLDVLPYWLRGVGHPDHGIEQTVVRGVNNVGFSQLGWDFVEELPPSSDARYEKVFVITRDDVELEIRLERQVID